MSIDNVDRDLSVDCLDRDMSVDCLDHLSSPGAAEPIPIASKTLVRWNPDTTPKGNPHGVPGALPLDEGGRGDPLDQWRGRNFGIRKTPD